MMTPAGQDLCPGYIRSRNLAGCRMMSSCGDHSQRSLERDDGNGSMEFSEEFWGACIIQAEEYTAHRSDMW